tara:strand:- start:4 stop:165 length:162 start_codon:yes stop_codon:yes gene_type:complete
MNEMEDDEVAPGDKRVVSFSSVFVVVFVPGVPGVPSVPGVLVPVLVPVPGVDG